ncbi:unnamed protein product [Orchesella dallaii]|uniref:Uncharacterized protein n=1 Tax=Orchesella dallaii TaxID=48710 RepID=A0ABP1PTL8_9HEXA
MENLINFDETVSDVSQATATTYVKEEDEEEEEKEKEKELWLSTGEKRVSLVRRRWDLEDELEGIKPGKLVFDEDFIAFASDKKCFTESVKRHENNHEMQVVTSSESSSSDTGGAILNNFYSGHTCEHQLEGINKTILDLN